MPDCIGYKGQYCRLWPSVVSVTPGSQRPVGVSSADLYCMYRIIPITALAKNVDKSASKRPVIAINAQLPNSSKLTKEQYQI